MRTEADADRYGVFRWEANMTRDDEKCPECGGSGLRDPDNGGPPVWSTTMRLEDCPTCNGTGKQPMLEPSSASPPNAAPHEHTEAEEAAYLEGSHD